MSGSDSPRSIKARQIIDVYHYLYRFSVERLHAFVSDTAMVTLFKYYFNTQGLKRIMKSSTMKKYREAYVEAGERITDSLSMQRTTSCGASNVNSTVNASSSQMGKQNVITHSPESAFSSGGMSGQVFGLNINCGSGYVNN